MEIVNLRTLFGQWKDDTIVLLMIEILVMLNFLNLSQMLQM